MEDDNNETPMLANCDKLTLAGGPNYNYNLEDNKRGGIMEFGI